MNSEASGISQQSPRERYTLFRAMGLNLNLTRGKPSTEQLDICTKMLQYGGIRADDRSDCRNYGYLEGLPEARTLFGQYLGVPADNTFALGNSSLSIMHDLVVQMVLRPITDTLGENPTMICPVPGYDRHHAICEKYGIKMLTVQMKEDGPDMDVVQKLIEDNNIIGMWCIPKYSNPSGITYSHEVCRKLARLKAGKGFRLFWDLAYQVHDLEEVGDVLPNMFELCREAGNEDRVFLIGSTSKITFAGAGVAMLGASIRNLDWFGESLATQTIGPDKLNQLRHVRLLKDMEGIRQLMARHRRIIKPKFDAVGEILTRRLGGSGIAWWNKPRGGYFVSLYVEPGCAKLVVKLAAEIGVKLTPAGSAFPYDDDPNDSHIRIAPTYPPLDEVRQAMEAVAVCVQIAAEE